MGVLDDMDFSNLGKAKRIVSEITVLRDIQKALKSAFAHRELDGGPLAALEHPLYLEAEQKIQALEEEFTQLI